MPRYRLRPPAPGDVAARQNDVTYSRVVAVIDTTFDLCAPDLAKLYGRSIASS